MDQTECWELYRKTARDKRKDVSLEDLITCHDKLCSCLAIMGNSQTQFQARIDELRLEIQTLQHRESIRLGRRTFWVAVAAVVVPVFVAVAFHILSSRPQPSKTDLDNSLPSLQTPAPRAVSPEPEMSSKIETPSPKQSATAQPSSTMQQS